MTLYVWEQGRLVTFAGTSFVNAAVLNGPVGNHYDYGIYSNAQTTLVNESLINFSEYNRAVDLAGSSTIINQVGATIEGGIVITGSAGTFANYGVLLGGASDGSGLDVINGAATDTSALISGNVGSGPAGTITNFGTIIGQPGPGAGVRVGSGGAVNGAPTSTKALITGGVNSYNGGSITNFGTLVSTGNAANGDGLITNGVSGRTIGTIISGSAGVSGTGTLVNYGVVGGTGPGGDGVDYQEPTPAGTSRPRNPARRC